MDASTQQKSVMILGLGGTISLALENGRAQPTDNMDQIVAGLPKVGHDIAVSSRSVLSKDSVDLTLEDLLALAQLIETEASRHHAFVVTTGTDTMEEVSYGLHLLLPDLCPIIVTGAMRPPYLPDYDGHDNLQDALAACDAFRRDQAGVFVAMAGQLIAAPYALKNNVSRKDAFVSTHDRHPPQKITRDMRVAAAERARAQGPRRSWNPADLPEISIVTASLGSRLDLNKTALPDGIVVACPGAHSISGQMLGDLAPMFETGRPVVLASRCAESGGAAEEVYPGYLTALEARGVVISDYRGLSPQKARLKMALDGRVSCSAR